LRENGPFVVHCVNDYEDIKKPSKILKVDGAPWGITFSKDGRWALSRGCARYKSWTIL